MGMSFVLVGLTPAMAENGATDVTVLHAAEFGAKPNSGEDSGPALRAAIAAAAALGAPVEIRLERGTYRLGPGPEFNSALLLRGMSDVTVRGAGVETLLLLTDPRQGCFFLFECERVSVESLAVDHDPLAYTQGSVLWSNAKEGWFDLALEEGYPSLGEPYFAEAPKPYGQWGMIFERDTPRLKAGAPDFIFMDSWEHLAGRVWRMRPVAEQRDRVAHLRPRDRFVHMARFGHGGAVFFLRSRDCAMRHVTVYSSQGFAVGGVAADACTVDGVTVTRKPGTTRLLSTDSDGAHFQQNLRGPLIQNCHFEGMADDSVNIYYPPNRVSGVVADNSLRLAGGGEIQPGDLLEIFDPVEGRRRGRSRAATVRGDATELRVTLENPVPGMRAGTTPNTSDSVYNLSRCGAGFTIRNNIFTNHRRHGMMLKAPDGLVENNLMDGLGALGIVAGNDPDWPEGVAPSNLVIRRNTIRDCGRSMWYGADPRGAAIQIVGKSLGGVAADRILENIVLEDNQCINPPGAALFIGAAGNVEVVRLNATYMPGFIPPRRTAAILVENVDNLRVEDCAASATQPEITATLRLGPEVGRRSTQNLRGSLASGAALVENTAPETNAENNGKESN